MEKIDKDDTYWMMVELRGKRASVKVLENILRERLNRCIADPYINDDAKVEYQEMLREVGDGAA